MRTELLGLRQSIERFWGDAEIVCGVHRSGFAPREIRNSGRAPPLRLETTGANAQMPVGLCGLHPPWMQTGANKMRKFILLLGQNLLYLHPESNSGSSC